MDPCLNAEIERPTLHTAPGTEAWTISRTGISTSVEVRPQIGLSEHAGTDLNGEPPLVPCSDASYAAARERFASNRVAIEYPAEYRNTRRDRREVRSILKALRDVPSHAHILDIPCGSGRLLNLLRDRGHSVTCADASELMVWLAQSRWQELRAASFRSAEPRFFVSDVMQTGFADREFDAVICNRLFHHFAESATRVRALSELERIAKGPVIVSFFNSFAVDALRSRLKYAYRRLVRGDRRLRIDRVPIPLSMFLSDVRRAGLDVVRAVPVRFGVSPMWYVVAQPSEMAAIRRRADSLVALAKD